MGAFDRVRKWKARLTPLEEICIDMGILFTLWMLVGVAFYYFCDEHWDATYSWFFAVNVGLGVGYGKYMLTENLTKCGAPPPPPAPFIQRPRRRR